MKAIHFIIPGFFCFVAQAQIASAQIFNPQTNDNTPVIRLNSSEYLIASFDELNAPIKNYQYTIEHADRNWEKSDLFQSQYLQGYFSDRIFDAQPSFNTLQNYTHYRLQIPNENMRPIFSGNYHLIIYLNRPEKPVLKMRFCIYEPLAPSMITKERNNATRGELGTQRLTIQVQAGHPIIQQMLNTASLTVIKNNNWNESISNLKPAFFNGTTWTYNPNQIIFKGGNEYLFFDTKDFRIQGMTTQRVKQNEFFEHYLHPDEPYPREYIFNPDVNGAFYIRRIDFGQERDANREADYVWVNFALKIPEQKNKDVYVVGGFNFHQPSEAYKMEYREEGYYEKSLFLKQGYYNYAYCTKDRSTGAISYWDYEGSFWETENLYQIFLYVRPFGFDYDALVGYGEFRQSR